MVMTMATRPTKERTNGQIVDAMIKGQSRWRPEEYLQSMTL